MSSSLDKVRQWWDKHIEERVFPEVMQWGMYVFVLLMYAGKFGTFKALAFYIAAFLWLIRLMIKQEAGFRWNDPLFICLLLLTLSAVVSSVLNANQVSSLVVVKKSYVKVVLLYCLIVTAFSDTTRLKRLALVMASTAVVYVIVAFYEIAGYLIREGRIHYLDIRYFATIILYFFPFVLLQYIESQGRKRMPWIVTTVASVIALIIISVRASWLAIAGVFVIWMYFLRGMFFKRVNLITTAAAVIFLVTVACFMFPSQYSLIKGHMQETVQMSHRFAQWQVFVLMSSQRLLYGHGLNQDDATEHYRQTFSHLYGRFPNKEERTTAHNQLLTILYQHGIVGLVVYIAAIWLALTRLYRRIIAEGTGNDSHVGIAVFATIVGEYVLRTIFEDRNIIPLGFLIGMTGAFTSEARRAVV
ncbi:O-antigen ligase-like protein [Candidatus Magnetobacterium bavaricum]|uniref:O-antigen ligase-like protein n=1 Tax=Candidatus Magnetobacterium bavaricum TaxID=29290 RepID=A0A0F3GRB0_9BACT|nr:O-antigen ligase-like protein [Candidatus Magnetobacterium bavaricum]